MKAAIACGLAGIVLGWVLASSGRPRRPGPSVDSLRVEGLIQLAHAAGQRADSVNAVNETLRSRLAARGDSVITAVRTARAKTPPPPPDTSAQAVDYWKARARSAEGLLDLSNAAHKVIEDSLSAGWASQIQETGRLRSLVGDLADSLQWVKDSLGSKDRQLAKARRPCRLGTVNGGWSPLSGKGELTIGGSCEALRLVRQIF